MMRCTHPPQPRSSYNRGNPWDNAKDEPQRISSASVVLSFPTRRSSDLKLLQKSTFEPDAEPNISPSDTKICLFGSGGITYQCYPTNPSLFHQVLRKKSHILNCIFKFHPYSGGI